MAEEQGQQKAPIAETPKKGFTRDNIKRTIPIALTLPLYPDSVFKFELRIKLSKDAEERRQECLSLAPAQITAREADQYLDELCDLMVNYPEGFEDLQKSLDPGPAFMDYVKTAPAEAKATLDKIVQGAMTVYWRTVSPREFRPTV